MKIVLGIPTYGNVRIETVKDLCALMGSRVQQGDKDYPIISRFSYCDGSDVVTTRNGVIRQAYKYDPDFTHLLFLDSDQCDFDIHSVMKLLEANKPIIAGVTVMRKKPEDAPRRPQTFIPIEMVGGPKYQEVALTGVIEVKCTGLFFTLIQKQVLDAMQEETPDGPVWIKSGRLFPRDSFGAEAEEFIKRNKNSGPDALREAIKLGLTAYNGAKFIGEDYEFCLRAKILGFKSYVHCGVQLGHIGSEVFRIGD